MLKSIGYGAAGLAALFAASTAMAGDLARERGRAAAEASLEAEVDYTNEVCGAAISSEIDWDSFEDSDLSDPESVAEYCDAALGAIENVCRASTAGRDAVADEIDEFVCAVGSRRSTELTAQRLTYTVADGGGDGFGYVKAFLADLLLD